MKNDSEKLETKKIERKRMPIIGMG